MGRIKDITGERFGRLVAVSREPNGKWLCNCDCGNTALVDGRKLRTGNTKSCKCYRNTLLADERRLGSGTAAFRELFRRYVKTAKTRGYEFNIDEDFVKGIVQSDCYYCGAEPSQVVNHRDCFGVFVYNGIDRVNNSIGYTEDNVVPCCKTCNYAKNTLELEDFRDWTIRISDKQRRGEW